MSTYTESQTFTITHAKYLASKIATDLKRIQRFYDGLSDAKIELFEEEAIALLRYGYLDEVYYGFKKDEKYIEPTLYYKAAELINLYSTDDDPGKIRPGADVTNASFHSFLKYSDKWSKLNENEQKAFEASIGIKRSYGTLPEINGYLMTDLSYANGGQLLNRKSLKSF